MTTAKTKRDLIEGNAEPQADGKVALHWGEGQPPIIAQGQTQPAQGSRCTFAIRPEKVAISKTRPEDRSNAIQGKIEDIAYLGNLSTYSVLLPGGTRIKAQTANNRRIARRELTWEDDVWLSWTETAGLVLDR